MLGHFSRVRLCVTPQMAANQASLSLGFSRQEHWSGLPFPSPMHESEVAQSCLTLSDPKDCSLPGSSVHGIFQARVLEWGAIALCKLFVGLQILCRDSQNFSVAFPCTSKEHICAGCCHFSPSCIQAQLHYCGNVIKMSCHFYLNRKH